MDDGTMYNRTMHDDGSWREVAAAVATRLGVDRDRGDRDDGQQQTHIASG